MRLARIALGMVSFAVPARASELWAPAPVLPEGGAEPLAAAGLAVRYDAGSVPSFLSGERDRLAVGVAGAAWVDERVCVRAEWAWLRDTSVAGGPVAGPGDLRIGTAVALVRSARIHAGAGWSVKLPNAADEDGLGTDETDAAFGVWAQLRGASWRVRADAGLSILGNPLRFANQDDVPSLGARGEWDLGPVTVGPVVAAEPATARNPARVSLGGRAEVGDAVFASAEGWAGLTPAAADFAGAVLIGWRGPGRAEERP